MEASILFFIAFDADVAGKSEVGEEAKQTPQRTTITPCTPPGLIMLDLSFPLALGMVYCGATLLPSNPIPLTIVPWPFTIMKSLSTL